MLIYLKAHIKRNQPWSKPDTTIVFSMCWSVIAEIRGFFFVDVSTKFFFSLANGFENCGMLYKYLSLICQRCVITTQYKLRPKTFCFKITQITQHLASKISILYQFLLLLPNC